MEQQKVEIAVPQDVPFPQRDSAPVIAITKAVSERVHSSKQSFVHIEEIQDMVQEELMKAGHFKVAEAYILFRAQRQLRIHGIAPAPVSAPAPVASGQATLIMVKKADGLNVFWDGADLRKRIEFARIGLDLCLSVEEIEAELRRSVYDQISQKDLDSTIILNSKTLIEKDADFAKFAGRIKLTYIYEEVLGWNIVRDGLGKLERIFTSAPSRNISSTASPSSGSTHACWSTISPSSAPRSIRRPTSSSTSSASRRCTIAT